MKLKQYRKNIQKEESKDIQNEISFSSMRIKYEELIMKDRNLLLPIKYKKLINDFTNLERAIGLNKIRIIKMQNNFNNIKNIKINDLKNHVIT